MRVEMEPYHTSAGEIIRGGTTDRYETDPNGFKFLRLFVSKEDEPRVEVHISMGEVIQMARDAKRNRGKRARQGCNTAKVER